MMNALRHGFAQPWALLLPAALLVLGVLALVARRRRRRALARLGSPYLLESQLSEEGGWRWMRRSCLLSALTGLAVGVAGPQWGRDWDQSVAPGRDVVVVLDVSRSMLAEEPSRLERARRALVDLSESVERRGGHRLALVAFAGRARVVCPLTHDYEHFRDVVRQLDADTFDAGPADDPADDGTPFGTRIGVALRLALTRLCPPESAGYQDVLLISDGDDPVRDEDARAGALAARTRGVPVHVVGVGDPEPSRASPVPARDGGPLLHNGKKVLSRLHEESLKEIADLTGGTYTPAHTRALPLGELFRDRIESAAVREDASDALPTYQQRYPLFLGPALAMLTLATLLGGWPARRAKHKATGPRSAEPQRKTAGRRGVVRWPEIGCGSCPVRRDPRGFFQPFWPCSAPARVRRRKTASAAAT